MPCAYRHSDGRPCGSRIGPLHPDGKCRFHTEAEGVRAHRLAASRRGGQNTHKRYYVNLDTKPPALTTLADALRWYQWVCEETAAGRMEPESARELTRVTDSWVRCQRYDSHLRELSKELATARRALKVKLR